MCLSQYEVQQGKQETASQRWRSPLLKLQELPKGFGWDRVAYKTTPLSWHQMQKTGKLEEQEI